MTAADRAAMADCVARWIEAGLCRQPCEREAAERAVCDIYAAIGLPGPEIVWVNSPYEGECLTPPTPDGAMANGLHYAMTGVVKGAAEYLVKKEVDGDVWAWAMDGVWRPVHNATSPVWGTIIRAFAPHKNPLDYGHPGNACWLGFYDFLSRWGGLRHFPGFAAMLTLCRTAGVWFPGKDACWISARPAFRQDQLEVGSTAIARASWAAPPDRQHGRARWAEDNR